MQSYGEKNTLAIADVTSVLYEYNIGLMGATNSVHANRMGSFVNAVQNYQSALMECRDAIVSNHAARATAKKKAFIAFQEMQKRFRHELTVVNTHSHSRRGAPLNCVTRATNIARSSRKISTLNINSQVQANNLIKFCKYGRYLGNGLAVIDFAGRAGNVYSSYKEGDEWERDLFIESSSFAASASAGILAVKAGSAALTFLVAATPVGWVGLIVGGVFVAGAAAATSITINKAIKDNSGSWYDAIMDWIRS